MYAAIEAIMLRNSAQLFLKSNIFFVLSNSASWIYFFMTHKVKQNFKSAVFLHCAVFFHIDLIYNIRSYKR